MRNNRQPVLWQNKAIGILALLSLLLVVLIPLCSGCGSREETTASFRKQTREEAPKAQPQIKPSGRLTVSFIDVGQGDAALLQLPNGQVMLIDAGTNQSGGVVVSYLEQQGIRRIDYLVATHPHEDHIGGMDQVINAFGIGSVFMPKVTTNTESFEAVLQALKERGKKITVAKAGVRVISQPGFQVSFLAPCGSGYEELNDWSVVTRVQFGQTAFLLTGDAQTESEQEMLSSGANLQADVLKVGHHGSHNSSSWAFLKAVSPRYAVISVGAGNDYGHPHQITLSRLSSIGARVYRTDLNGTVVITSDGRTLTVKTFRNQVKPASSGQTPTALATDNGGGYIGNKNSHKFHRPDCSYLPAPKNRVYFQSREQALAAGYLPCKICRP